MREALSGQELIPVAGGGYRRAGPGAGRRRGLHDLLSPDQLGALSGAGGPLWLRGRVHHRAATPVLWRYLRDEIGVAEITPRTWSRGSPTDFLAAQPDEWIARYYAFL